MDHRAFLESLDTETRNELHTTSDRRGLIALALHGLLIILLALPVALKLPFWPLFMLPLGIALAFTFTLQHECTHRTPFASGWLNELTGHLTAAILVQPFLWFRYFHLAHHKYTNDPAQDPELQGAPKPESWAALSWHLLALGYWRDKLALLWQNAFGAITGPYIPPRTHARLRREARLLIALYAVVAAYSLFISPILIRLWLIPMGLGFPVLRFYLLAEHARCAHVTNMFANSRTVLTGPLIRMLAWNMPYHAEHHSAPNVPFHRLGDLHRLIRAHLEVTESGYLRFALRYVAGFSDNGKPPRTVSSQ